MKTKLPITVVSFLSMIGPVVASPVAIAQSTVHQAPIRISQAEGVTQLCDQEESISSRLDCLFEQSNRLNQAKNFARQRGEQINGGIIRFETEPSMHGPSADSPHTIEDSETATRYTFTFRLRPRGSNTYTRETQVLANYDKLSQQWSFETVYNREIAPTTCSYAEELQGSC